MDADEPIPTATLVKPPAKISGVITVALLLVVVGTVIGFVMAMLAAFIAVHIGMGAEKIVIGMPLIAVGTLAWGLTKQDLRAGLITIVIAGAIAAALFVVWAPRSPSYLFTHESKVTDVQVHGNDATMTLESKTKITEMPPVGATFGYAALLACLCIVGATIGHGAMSLKKPPKPF